MDFTSHIRKSLLDFTTEKIQKVGFGFFPCFEDTIDVYMVWGSVDQRIAKVKDSEDSASDAIGRRVT